MMTDQSADASLFLLTLLSGLPKDRFLAECQRVFTTYVEVGLAAGWSRAVAEEFAEEEIERVSETLTAIRSRFSTTAGRC